MKTFMMMTVLMVAGLAQAKTKPEGYKTYNVVCQKPAGFVPFSFTGSGTVGFSEEQDLDAADEQKDGEHHITRGNADADMDLVLSSPEGSVDFHGTYTDGGFVYTIPAMDLMAHKVFKLELGGQKGSQSGTLHMLLDGPTTGGTSKVVTGNQIYWSNCQFVK